MTTPAPSFYAVAHFLRRHLPARRAQAIKGFAHWLFWYWREARVGVVHARGQIVAVGLARCITEPSQGDQPYAHDEAAPLVWVQDVASTDPLGLPLMLAQVLNRFGPREAFAGHVFTRNNELRLIPFRTVQRLAALPA